MSKHLPPPKNKHEQLPKPSVLNVSLRERRTNRVQNELTELCAKNYAFIGAAAGFMAAGFIFADGTWLTISLFAVSFLLSAFQLIMRAADEVMGLKFLEADVLILLSGLVAFSVGAYGAAALLMLIYRITKLAEGLLEKKNREISEYFKTLVPESARLVTDTGFDECEPERLAENDVVEVRKGEMFPVDGRIVAGMSSMDTEALTGVSGNTAVSEGSRVYCGCINSGDTVHVKAESIFADSGLSKLCTYLERAGRYKTKLEKLADKIEHYFTPIVVILALVAGVIVPVFDKNWVVWLGRAAVLLAVSPSISLGLSLSFSCRSAIAWAVRRGIFIKGNCFVEALADTQTFVFNKTGTLTEGVYRLVELVPSGIEEHELLAVAAHAESGSEHPIAKAICRAYGPHAGAGMNIECEEVDGLGVVSKVNGKNILVGNASHLAEHGIECPITRKGGSAIHVAINGIYAGHMILVDKIRENAFDQLEMLRVQGIRNMITLTSDVLSVARPLASSLNMDMVRAELSCEGKVSAVEYLAATKAEHSTLAFVCNGAGDLAALRRADVGISLGALGADEAYEAGDVLIMNTRLSSLAEIMRISRYVNRLAVISSILFAAVKLCLTLLAFSGVFGLFAAVIINFVLDIFLYASSISVINYNGENRRKFK